MALRDGEFPTEGYLGTNKPRTGRELPLPEWVAALLRDGEQLYFSYHPDEYFPVFSSNREALRSSQNKRRWPQVGDNPVRIDNNQPVVQLPPRFFDDYKGPQTAISLDPVTEESQIDLSLKLHFVFGWPSFTDNFQCFLLTTENLAQVEREFLPEVFSEHRQRSRLLDNLGASDMEETPQAVIQLFEHLSELIIE